MSKNPFAGHKILCYDVHHKVPPSKDYGFLFRGKTRKSAELYMKNALYRGQYKLSRIRLIDGLNHREDLYEIAKS